MHRVKTMLQDSRGALLVEMALVFPIVLLLTIGTLELALFMFQANAATKGAQLGVRWAVVNPPVSAALQTDLADTSWWDVGTLGESCQTVLNGCRPAPGTNYVCTSGSTGCDLSKIIVEMQKAFPTLQASEVAVSYEPYNPLTKHAIGFVGRPGGTPVDVVVTICKQFEFVFLDGFVPAFANPAPPADCSGRPNGFYTPAKTRLSSESFGPPPVGM